jgi:hypothetical protein
MFSNLELRIVATLAYSNQFEFPLTSSEVFRRLVSSQTMADEGWGSSKSPDSITQSQIDVALQKLSREKLVETNGLYWVLAGKKTCFSRRVGAQRCTQQKTPLITQLLQLLRVVPWIEAIFITGSVAVQNARQHDDIDVLIVTRPRRLWLVRMSVLILAILAGKRVQIRDQNGPGWCFNLWLESDHLAVPSSKRSLYEAYEILQAQCIWERPSLYRQWLTQNQWVRNFVPTEYKRLLNQSGGLEKSRSTTKTFTVLTVFGDMCNWLAYGLQSSYRLIRYREKPKLFEAAFFHSSVTKQIIYSQWRMLVGQIYSPSLSRKNTNFIHSTD